MLRPIDQYFLDKPEPVKSCLQFLRDYILGLDAGVEEAWRYGMPFYLYNRKRFCYLWVHKKLGQPYIGLTDGLKIDDPCLLQEQRSRMKILLVDPAEDIPLEKIREILNIAMSFNR